MKILAVANQKGGMGKTPLSVHVAYAANEKGLRVLVADFDEQGSLSLSFPKEGEGDFIKASNLFMGDGVKLPLEKLASGVSIVRADDRLEAVNAGGKQLIKNPAVFFAQIKDDFDVCVIDTPPSLGACLKGALCASNYVITPTKVGLYELSGVRKLMNTIQDVRTQFGNPRLKHIGILPTLIDTKSPIEMAALRELQAAFSKSMFPFYLPTRAALKQAAMKRKPVWVGTQGGGHLAAAREWSAACSTILSKMDL